MVEGFLESAEGAAFELAGEPRRVCLDGGRSDTHFLARLTRME